MSDFDQLLAAVQAWQVLGYKAEALTAKYAIMFKRKEINHVLHFVLSLLTGFWFFVWLYLVVFQHSDRHVLTVVDGVVTSRKL